MPRLGLTYTVIDQNHRSSGRLCRVFIDAPRVAAILNDHVIEQIPVGRRSQRRAQIDAVALLLHGGIATTAQLLEWAYPRGPGRDRRQRKARAIAVSHAAVTVVA